MAVKGYHIFHLMKCNLRQWCEVLRKQVRQMHLQKQKQHMKDKEPLHQDLLKVMFHLDTQRLWQDRQDMHLQLVDQWDCIQPRKQDQLHMVAQR